MENKENIFSFKRLLEYEKDNQGDPNQLLVLTDKYIDENTPGNVRVEMLLEKLMSDKSLINDKVFAESQIDNLLSQIYLNLSPDAFKIMNEEYFIKFFYSYL